MSETEVPEYQQVALDFAEALAERDYSSAYVLTSDDFRQRVGMEQMREDFEVSVPPDWGPIGDIDVDQVMEEWPDQKPDDLAWVFVRIGGELYSEELRVVVVRDGNELRINEVDFGRL